MSEDHSSYFTAPDWARYVWGGLPKSLQAKLSFYDLECLWKACKDYYEMEKPLSSLPEKEHQTNWR